MRLKSTDVLNKTCSVTQRPTLLAHFTLHVHRIKQLERMLSLATQIKTLLK